jgi:hypothetical protein
VVSDASGEIVELAQLSWRGFSVYSRDLGLQDGSLGRIAIELSRTGTGE